MPSTKPRKLQDSATDAIYTALKERFPALPEEKSRVVYRLNSASIRVCVIDPGFEGKSLSERDAEVMAALRKVPKMVRNDISLLLVLTPDEMDESSSHQLQEFDHPIAAQL